MPKKPEGRIFFQVSHMGVEVQEVGTPSTAFPATLAGSGVSRESNGGPYEKQVPYKICHDTSTWSLAF